MAELMEAEIWFLCVRMWSKDRGIGDCWIGGRIVVVRQIDFQANQLSRLYLQGGEKRCVCA